MQSSPSYHKLKETSVDVKKVGNKTTLKEIVESENASSDISVCSDFSLLDGSSSVLSDVSFGWEEIAAIEKLNMDSPDENGSGSHSSEKRPDKVKLKWGANRFFDEANENSSEVRPTGNNHEHEISTGENKQINVADENSSEGTADDDDEISSGENKQIDRSTCLQEMVKTDRPRRNSVAFGNLTKENHKNIGSPKVSRSESQEDVMKEKKLKHEVNESHIFHKHSEDSDESINDGKKVTRIQKNNRSEPHDISRSEDSDTDVGLEETRESNVKVQQNCRRISEPHNMSHSDDDNTYYSAEETRNKNVNKKLKQEEVDGNNTSICQTKLQSTGKMLALFNSEEYNPVTPSIELELGQLTEDDEIWMIQCPITLDPQNLKNKDLVFRGSSDLTFQLKENKQSYETTTFDTKKSVSCLLYSKTDHCQKAMVLHPVGLMVIKEIVDVPELETFSLPRQNNLQLPNDLKIRHPLFGIGYATELQLRNELSNHHSMAADNDLLTYESRTQKDFNSMKEDTCHKKKKQDNEDKITEEYENNSTNFNLQQKNHHKTKNKEKEDKLKGGKTVTSHQMKRKREMYEPLSESVDNLFDVKRKKYSHEERPEGEVIDNEGKILNANKDFLGIEESIRNKKKKLRVEAHTISNQFIDATELVENPKEMGRTENSVTNGSEILNICLEKMKHKKKKKRMKTRVDLMEAVEEKSPSVKTMRYYDTSFSEETATSRDRLIVKENAKNKYNVSDNSVLISELDVSLDSDGNELKKKKKKYKTNAPEDCIIKPKEAVVPENGYRLKKKKANYGKKLKKNKQNIFGDDIPVEDLTPDGNECKLKKNKHVYGKCEETLKSEDDLIPENDEYKLKRSELSMSDENLMKSEDNLKTGRDTHKLKKNKHKRMSVGEKKYQDMSEGDLLASEEDIMQGNDKHKVKKKKYKHKKSKENVLECGEFEVTENDGQKLKKKKYKLIMSEEGLTPENDDHNLKKNKHKYGISEDDLVTGNDEFTLQKKEHKSSMSEDSILKCEDDVITRNEYELKKKIHSIIRSDEHKFKKKKRRHNLFENSLLKYESDKHIIKKKHKHIMCEGSVSESKESVIRNDECKVKKIKHKHSMSEASLLKCGQNSVQENDEFKLEKKKRKKRKHSMLNNTIFKREDLIPESDSISQINKKRRDSVPSDNILKFEGIGLLTEIEHNSERRKKKSGDGILNCEVNVRQKYDKHKVKKKKKHKCDMSPNKL